MSAPPDADKATLRASKKPASSSSRGKRLAGAGGEPVAGRESGIWYTIRESTLEKIAVAASAEGICAVSLGADEGALAEELAAIVADGATLRRNDEALRSWSDAVLQHFEEGGSSVRLPLDLRGTDFQKRVWCALREIPRGETRTYGEVARILGEPGSVRAVASACAANRVAVVVPCHRVLRKDGGLGGYRWGLDIKRRLLQKEAPSIGLFG